MDVDRTNYADISFVAGSWRYDDSRDLILYSIN